MTHSLTSEQEAILSAGRETSKNLEVKAFAGCTKSYTSTALARVLPPGPAASLCFNTKIKEASAKLLPSHFDTLTMNGLGHRAWGSMLRKRLELDDKKVGRLITSLAKQHSIRLHEDGWGEVRDLVAYAMQQGLVPPKFQHTARGLIPNDEASWKSLCEDRWIEPLEEILFLAEQVLTANILEAYQGKISFDDQIYCSSLLGGSFPKWPLVFVDEAQDLSRLNHIMLGKISSERLIVVGDPLQSIYAFRGAHTSSMGEIRKLKPADSWLSLPLSTTFRCPQKVVDLVKYHAVGFNAAPGNLPGSIHYPDQASSEFPDGKPWNWKLIEEISRGQSLAVICRNNAPLLSLAFKLLRRQIPVQMLGREIGKGLVSLAKKICKEGLNAADCAAAISDWRDTQVSLARASGKEEKISGIDDRAECLLAVLEGAPCRDSTELQSALSRLFAKDSGRVVLGTGHKMKGLEFDTVLHLDPWRIPSKYAKKAAEAGFPEQLQQERNLEYVINTRTRDVLIFASLENYQS